MKHRHLLVFLSVSLLLLTVVSTVVVGRARDVARTGQIPAIEHVASLIPALVPGARTMQLTADRAEETSGAQECQWRVSGSDGPETSLTVLVRARDGQILHVWVTRPHERSARGRRLTAAEAVDAAWSWMSKLGLARSSSEWRLVGRPLGLAGGWHIRWQTRSAIAFVDLAPDGALDCARLIDEPGAVRRR